MKKHIDHVIANCGYKPKILVVDDQSINIQVVYSIFKGQFNVVMAMNGEQALEQAEKHRPDLIMLDVMMPGMDGYEVCQRLKANPETSEIPLIFLTGHDDPANEQRGLELGAVDFFSKPVNRLLVEARVRAYLALKLQTDALNSLPASAPSSHDAI